MSVEVRCLCWIILIILQFYMLNDAQKGKGSHLTIVCLIANLFAVCLFSCVP